MNSYRINVKLNKGVIESTTRTSVSDKDLKHILIKYGIIESQFIDGWNKESYNCIRLRELVYAIKFMIMLFDGKHDAQILNDFLI